MGITGLILSGFVFGHMAGNMLIFAGPEFFNSYGHAIVSNKPLLYGSEAVLLLAVFLHMAFGIWLTKDNKAAAGAASDNRYAVSASKDKESPLSSRTMIYTGVVIAVFIVLHLLHFKYGEYYTIVHDGVEMRDLHRLVVELFHEPVYVAWYVGALVLLCMHLRHGFEACWQSLGFRHPVYSEYIYKISWAYALVVSLGFISQPLYVYFFYKG